MNLVNKTEADRINKNFALAPKCSHFMSQIFPYFYLTDWWDKNELLVCMDLMVLLFVAIQDVNVAWLPFVYITCSLCLECECT